MLCALAAARTSPQVLTTAALLALLVLGEGSARADDPLLSAPTERLDTLIPRAALDGFTLPAKPLPKKPVRVAARPGLDWRPGLLAVSERDDDAPKAEAPEATPSQVDKAPAKEPKLLQPVVTAPLLTPPKQSKPEPAGKKDETSSEKENAADRSKPPKSAIKAPKAPAVDRLPEQVPRNEPAKDEAKPEPASEPEPKQPAKVDKAKPEEPKTAEPANDKTKPAPTKEEAKPAPAKPAAKPPAPLSRSLRNLRSRLRTVLSFYYRKPFDTATHDPWEIMHGMLAYELHSRIRDGGPRGRYLTAVGHLCFNRPSKRQQMMAVTPDGRIDVRVGVGLQGHKGQLMAMLAQCNVSPDYPIRVDGREFTIHDLIEAEQRTCYARTELTFKLIGLGHYLDSDARWLNDQGEAWDIPRLIKEERTQPIRGAACGGTHRLSGLSLAFRRREARGEPLDGEYAEAARFVREYQNYAFRLQNSDGSLSTEWFRGRGNEDDKDRHLRTTGHTLEWLAYSLSDDELRSHQTVRAVNYLTNLLSGNADHEWHTGSLPHALHALVVYDKRVFGPHDDSTNQVAAIDPTTNLFKGYPIYRGVMRNSPPEPSGFFGLFGPSRTSSNSRSRSR